MDVRNGKAIIYNGLEVSGSSVLTGTLNVTDGITGSLFGTSSWASNALTSSFITPTGTNAFVQNGNSFGTTALLGTNDTQDLQLETSGSVRMTISSSGNVGIGTTSPSSRLEVTHNSSGVAKFEKTSGAVGTIVEIRGNTDDKLLSFWRAGVERAYIDIVSGNLTIGANNKDINLIPGTGNVAIGTTSPTSRLQVQGGGATSATTALRVENSNATASLVVLDDGNVGIGTTSPLYKLYVDSGTSDYPAAFVSSDTTSQIIFKDSTTTAFGSVRVGAVGNELRLNSGPNGTEGILTMNASGNVGIGTTSPSVRLHISGTSATNELVYLTGDASQGSTIRFNRGSSYSWRMGVVPNSNFTIEDVSYSTVRFQINNTSGLIGINTTSPNARLHISGANNEALLIASSSTAPSALFVSGSGNVGIGTTTPTALFQITNRFKFNSDGTANWGASAANGLLTWDTGKARILGMEGNDLSFGSNAVADQLYIKSGSGNVGIGTTSPTERLHVDGNLLVTGRVTAEEFHTEFVSASIIYQSGSTQFGNSSDDTHIFTGSLRVNGSITGSLFGTSSWAINALTASFVNTASTNAFVQGGNSFGTTALLGTNDTQDLQLETNGSVRMTISSSGNVGIGTTTPSTLLHVSGTVANPIIIERSTSNSNIYIQYKNATTSWYAGQTDQNTFGIGTNSALGASTIFNISSSGNIGIGTTTPSRALEIVNSSAPQLRIRDGVSGGNLDLQSDGSGQAKITFASNGYVAAEASALRVNGQGSVGLWLETNAATKPVEIKPNGTTRLIVSASGNVGIGTTTPTQRLDVRGNTILAGTTPVNPIGGTLEVYNNGSNAQITIHEDSGSAEARLAFRTGANDTIFRNLTTRFLIDAESKADAIVINSDGRVGIGIGNNAPSSVLQIRGEGATSATTALRVENSSADARLTILDDGTSAFNTSHLYISSSGRIGIGTTSPTQVLDVSGSIALAGNVVQQLTNLDIKVSGTQEGRALRFIASSAGARIQAIGSTTSNLSLSTTVASSEVTRMTILEGGNVGIGETSPSARLEIRGSGATSATTALRVENSNASASLVVLDNGNVGIGTTTPSASLHIEGNFQISTGSLYTYGQNTDIDSGSIRTVMSVSTGSYRAAFFDYVLNKSTNARAGTVFSVWNGASVEWNDVSTNDIGNTAEINLSVGLSGANVILYASSSTNDWSVKALARML